MASTAAADSALSELKQTAKLFRESLFYNQLTEEDCFSTFADESGVLLLAEFKQVCDDLHLPSSVEVVEQLFSYLQKLTIGEKVAVAHAEISEVDFLTQSQFCNGLRMLDPNNPQTEEIKKKLFLGIRSSGKTPRQIFRELAAAPSSSAPSVDTISLKDFLQDCSSRDFGVSKEDLSQVFHIFNSNGTGYMSMSEWLRGISMIRLDEARLPSEKQFSEKGLAAVKEVFQLLPMTPSECFEEFLDNIERERRIITLASFGDGLRQLGVLNRISPTVVEDAFDQLDLNWNGNLGLTEWQSAWKYGVGSDNLFVLDCAARSAMHHFSLILLRSGCRSIDDVMLQLKAGPDDSVGPVEFKDFLDQSGLSILDEAAVARMVELLMGQEIAITRSALLRMFKTEINDYVLRRVAAAHGISAECVHAISSARLLSLSRPVSQGLLSLAVWVKKEALEVSAAFRRLDANYSGELSVGELEKVPGVGRERAGDLMVALDVDGDGRVSVEDWVSALDLVGDEDVSLEQVAAILPKVARAEVEKVANGLVAHPYQHLTVLEVMGIAILQSGMSAASIFDMLVAASPLKYEKLVPLSFIEHMLFASIGDYIGNIERSELRSLFASSNSSGGEESVPAGELNVDLESFTAVFARCAAPFYLCSLVYLRHIENVQRQQEEALQEELSVHKNTAAVIEKQRTQIAYLEEELQTKIAALEESGRRNALDSLQIESDQELLRLKNIEIAELTGALNMLQIDSARNEDRHCRRICALESVLSALEDNARFLSRSEAAMPLKDARISELEILSSTLSAEYYSAIATLTAKEVEFNESKAQLGLKLSELSKSTTADLTSREQEISELKSRLHGANAALENNRTGHAVEIDKYRDMLDKLREREKELTEETIELKSKLRTDSGLQSSALCRSLSSQLESVAAELSRMRDECERLREVSNNFRDQVERLTFERDEERTLVEVLRLDIEKRQTAEKQATLAPSSTNLSFIRDRSFAPSIAEDQLKKDLHTAMVALDAAEDGRKRLVRDTITVIESVLNELDQLKIRDEIRGLNESVGGDSNGEESGVFDLMSKNSVGNMIPAQILESQKSLATAESNLHSMLSFLVNKHGRGVTPDLDHETPAIAEVEQPLHSSAAKLLLHHICKESICPHLSLSVDNVNAAPDMRQFLTSSSPPPVLLSVQVAKEASGGCSVHVWLAHASEGSAPGLPGFGVKNSDTHASTVVSETLEFWKRASEMEDRLAAAATREVELMDTLQLSRNELAHAKTELGGVLEEMGRLRSVFDEKDGKVIFLQSEVAKIAAECKENKGKAETLEIMLRAAEQNLVAEEARVRSTGASNGALQKQAHVMRNLLEGERVQLVTARETILALEGQLAELKAQRNSEIAERDELRARFEGVVRSHEAAIVLNGQRETLELELTEKLEESRRAFFGAVSELREVKSSLQILERDNELLKQTLEDRNLELRESVGKKQWAAELQSSLGEIAMLKNELDDCREKMREAECSLQLAQQQGERELSELKMALESEVEKSGKRRADYEEYEDLRSRAENGAAERKHLETRLEHSDTKLAAAIAQLAALRVTRDAAVAEGREAKKDAEISQCLVNSLTADLSEAKRMVAAETERCSGLQEKMEELERKSRDTEGRNESLEAELSGLRARLIEMGAEHLSEMELLIEKNALRIAGLEGELEAAQEERLRLRGEIVGLLEGRSVLEAQVEEGFALAKVLREEMEHLKSEHSEKSTNWADHAEGLALGSERMSEDLKMAVESGESIANQLQALEEELDQSRRQLEIQSGLLVQERKIVCSLRLEKNSLAEMLGRALGDNERISIVLGERERESDAMVEEVAQLKAELARVRQHQALQKISFQFAAHGEGAIQRLDNGHRGKSQVEHLRTLVAQGRGRGEGEVAWVQQDENEPSFRGNSIGRVLLPSPPQHVWLDPS